MAKALVNGGASTVPVECFRPASPLFHLGFAGSHQREPVMLRDSDTFVDISPDLPGGSEIEIDVIHWTTFGPNVGIGLHLDAYIERLLVQSSLHLPLECGVGRLPTNGICLEKNITKQCPKVL
jgi:hypothetical protein